MVLDRLIRFYEELTPESATRFADFYAENAYFKDPFNEVSGVAAIQRIFTHMFRQVADPRFIVTERLGDAKSAMLVWEFRFRLQRWGSDKEEHIRGVSHLRFDNGDKVIYHRDYWDAAEELYAKLPVLSRIMRWLRRAMAA